MEVIRKYLGHVLPEFLGEIDVPLSSCCILQEFCEDVTENILPDGRRKTIIRRKLKKPKGDKSEIINIITTQTCDDEPVRCVIIEDTFIELANRPIGYVLELPEDVDIIEISTSDGKPKKKITKKRTLLKKVGPKIEATEIITILEDDQPPQQSVNIKEFLEETKPKHEKDSQVKGKIKLKKFPKKHAIEVIEVVPSTMQITEKGELPLLSQIKLKKPKIAPKRPQKKDMFPKIRLSSRIVTVTFPSEQEKEKRGIISILPAYKKDHGTLSRNLKEANEVLKKKKYKKFKDIDIESPNLEKIEDLKFPNKTKDKEEPDAASYKKQSIQPEKDEDNKSKIKIGKGTIPYNEDHKEEINLRKVPLKTLDIHEPTEEEVGANLEETNQHENRKLDAILGELEIEPLDSSVRDSDDNHRLVSFSETSKVPKKKEKGKYKRKHSPNSEPDSEKTDLNFGESQKLTKPEDEEQSFKIKQKPPNDSPIDEIKLKPFTKLPEDNILFKVEEFTNDAKALGTKVIELPEEIVETTEVTPDGRTVKKVTKKRIIKKKCGPKQREITIETTTSEDGIQEATIKESEITSDEPTPSDGLEITELPLVIKDIKEYDDTGTKKEKKLKKRVFLKEIHNGDEVTEIVTTTENGKQPETILNVYIIEKETVEGETAEIKDFSIKHRKITPKFTPLKTFKTITEVHTLESTQDTFIGSIDEDVGKATGKLVHDIKESVIIQQVQTQKPIDKVPQSAKPEYPYIEELPEEIEIVETVDQEKPIKKIIKKRVIKKREGKKEEITEIITVEEEGKEPQTTVIVEEAETSDIPTLKNEMTENMPPTSVTIQEIQDTEVQKPLILEEPEEVTIKEVETQEGVKKQVIRKRKIKKQQDNKQQITEIVTILEDGKKPETTVTTEENDSTELVPDSQSIIVEELPEEVIINNVDTSAGPKKQIIKKRLIKKLKGDKQECTQIITVEEEGKKPETAVIIEEVDIPAEVEEKKPKRPKQKETKLVKEEEVKLITADGILFVPTLVDKNKDTENILELVKVELLKKALAQPIPESKQIEDEIVVELPEQVQIFEDYEEGGKTKKRVIKKRVIKKQKGGKQEKTEIVTIEEEGKIPETTVTVEELEAPEEIYPEKPVYTVEELPEEVQVSEVVTKDGKTKKRVVKKRVIKKQKDGKQEKTEIVTIEEEGKKPETTVTVEELEAPEEIYPEKPVYTVEELPEEVQVSEIVTKDGKTKKRVVKKRVIKKQKDGKQEKTEIVTIEEEGKKPETTVIVEELEAPEEIYPEKPVYYVEELPEEVQVSEVVTKDGKTKKRVVKTRVIKKQKDGKQEKTEIVTIEEEGKKPETTVIVQELDAPEEIYPEKPVYTVEELPEEVQVSEVVTKDGKTKKRVVKKRVIKKQKDGKQEKTEIVTIEEEGKKPETTVTVEELEAPEEIYPEKPVYTVEELPEEVQVSEIVTKDGKTKKRVVKKRVIKKQKYGKQEKTEIVTIEEEGKKPETTVIVEELEAPEEIYPEKPVYYVEELPEEVQVSEVVTKDGKTKKRVVKTRVIKKQKDGKQEKTEIVTIEEEGKKPETTVTVEELEAPEEIYPEKPVYTVEELPEEVQVSEIVTKDGKTKNRVVKKRVIKKQKGEKQEKTEIVIIEEEGKKPETTVTMEEMESPEEVQPETPVCSVEELPESKETEYEIVVELPQKVQIFEDYKKDGTNKKVTVKQRIIKKRKGSKQEITKICQVEEEGRKTETTVTIDEVDIALEELSDIPTIEEYLATPVIELPEEVKVTEIITEEGPKKSIIKKRVLKKRKGSREEITEIITKEEEGKKPQTTVVVEEIEIPEEELRYAEPVVTELFPEEIKVIDDKSKKKIIKKKVIRQREGKKAQDTSIVTVEEEGKEPEHYVTIEEIDVPDEYPTTKVPENIIEELPEEIQIIEQINKYGKPEKKTIKKRVLSKRKGPKDEVIKIVTVEEQGKKPQSTITIEEIDISEDDRKIIEPISVEEIPEEVKIIEIIPKEGSPVKQTVKERIIKKRKGNKEEKTTISTVEEEGKAPITTIAVEEREITLDTTNELQLPKMCTAIFIEELPERVVVLETDVSEDKPKKIMKTRTIKKPKGSTEELITIVTVEEKGKEPQTSVVIEEKKLEDIEPEHKKPKRKTVKKQKPKESKLDLPEEEKEKIAGDGKPQLRKEVSVLMPIERKEIKPQKVKIINNKDIPNLAEIKLRKPKVAPKKEIKSKIPRFLLKSRIKFVDFPPLNEKEMLPKISILEPVYRDNGILSRTVKEAENIPKTKKRRLRDKDIPLKDLEKLDLELEEIKKRELEKVDDQYRSEKQPRKKSVSQDEPKKIIPKKGKIPESTEDEETIKLKPVPGITKVQKEEDEQKTEKEPAKTVNKPEKPDSDEKHKLEFSPFDIERESPTKDEYEPTIPQEKDKATISLEETILPKSKKIKKAPETEISELVKGKPKPQTAEDVPEIKLKYKQKPKPEDEEQDIRLKPFKKEKEGAEQIVEVVDGLELSEMPIIINDNEEEESIKDNKIKKKRIIKKIKKTPEAVPEREEISPEQYSIKEHPSEAKLSEDEPISEIQIPDEDKQVLEEKPLDNETDNEEALIKLRKKKKLPKEKLDDKECTSKHLQHEELAEHIPTIIEDAGTKSKPVLMKLEEKLVSPKHGKVTPVEEIPKIAEVKLKKPKVPIKMETKTKIPKFLLKSRIVHIQFPPLSESEQFGSMKDLAPVYRDNGVLSRNVAEADKLPKKKRRKIKDIEVEFKDLEKLDMELDEIKKPNLEKVDDEYRYKKQPKEKHEEPIEDKKIVIGKGKLPQQQENEETVNLRKVTKEALDTLQAIEVSIKLSDSQVISIAEEDEVKPEVISFKPDDTEVESSEFEKCEPTEPVDKEKKEDTKVIRKVKKVKKIIKPETEEFLLEKGKPKPKEEEAISDKEHTYKQKEKSPEPTEEIKLKPFKKSKDVLDLEVVAEAIVPKYTPISQDGEDEIETTAKTIKKKTKKTKKSIKPTTTEEVIVDDVTTITEEISPDDSILNEIYPDDIEADVHLEEISPLIEEIPLPEEKPLIIETKEDDKLSEKRIVKHKIKKAKKPGAKEDLKDEEILQEKPKLMTAKHISVEKPKQPIITQKIPEFAEIKLKKLKDIPKIKESEKKIKKPLLKSRLQLNDFPPLTEKEQKALIKELEPVYRDNGILSRNVNEAEKVKPKKKKLVKRIKDLEKLDKELEELKKRKPEKVAEEYRQKLGPQKKEKPVLMKVIRVSVTPQKAKVIDITPEVINLADIKLKKTKAPKKEEAIIKLPKLKLKSRIVHIDFPPLSEILQKPQVTDLGAKRDNGILSRNVEEAEKIKKTKIKKVKKPKVEFPELEALDLEFEEIKKKEPEIVDEAFKYQRKPKEDSKEEEIEPIKIKLGKGKVPEENELREDVKLKKVKTKPTEKIDEEKQHKKLEQEIQQKPQKTEVDEDGRKIEFEPIDIERDDNKKSEYEKPADEKEPSEKERKDKPKYKQKKTDKPVPESTETLLEKGIPKIPSREDEPEVKFRIPQKDLSDEEPEKITLKPFKKPPKEEEEQTIDISIKPSPEIGKTEDIITETIKKKVPKKKKMAKESLENSTEDTIPDDVPTFEDESPKEQVIEKDTPTYIEKTTESLEIEQVTPAEPHVVTDNDTAKPVIRDKDSVLKEPTRTIDNAEVKPEAKLKTKKVIKTKDVKKPELSKIMLKSRIKYIDFPPRSEAQVKPLIKEMQTPIKDNGVLSRNITDAAKLKPKRKIKKPSLEKLDKEFEELKKEPEKVDEEFRKKPIRVRKEKPIPMEIIRKTVAAQKPKIVEIKPEIVNFAEIKLKSPKIPVKQEESIKIPKMRLKSRINYVGFPPLSEILRIPQLTNIGAIKQNAIISRNIKEAEKIKKTKIKKMKDVDKDLQDLEKLDLEFEDLKKTKPEAIDEAFKYKKIPKSTTEESEAVTVPLQIRKGKIPEKVEETENTVQLKKRPTKELESLPEDIVKEKRISDSSPKDSEPKPEVDIKGPNFEPFDIKRDSPEKIELDLPDPEILEDKEPQKDKSQYVPKKKQKPEPETVEIPIIKGKPKSPEKEVEDDVNFRIPQRDKPDDEPETITLKPFKKNDKSNDQEVDVEEHDKPTAIIKEMPKDNEQQKIEPKPKKKIPKKVHKPDDKKEEVPQIEDVETEFILKRRDSEKAEEPEDVAVILPKKVSAPDDEVVTDISVKLKPEPLITASEPQDTCAEFTIVEQPKEEKIVEQPKEEEIVEKVLIKKKKISKKPKEGEDEVEVEFTLPKKETTEDVDNILETTEATLKTKSAKLVQEEDAEAELSVKSTTLYPLEDEDKIEEIAEKRPEEDREKSIEQDIIVPIKPKKKVKKTKEDKTMQKLPTDQKPQVVDDDIQVIIPRKDIPKVEDENEVDTEITIQPASKEDVELEMPKKKIESDEEVEDELKLKKLLVEEENMVALTQPPEEVYEKMVIKKPQRKPKDEEIVDAEITVKKIVPVPDVDSSEEAVVKPPVEEPAETITLKKRKKKPELEEQSEAELTIKKIVKLPQPDVQEDISVKPPLEEPTENLVIKKLKKKPQEDGIAEITIKKEGPLPDEISQEETEITAKTPLEDLYESITTTEIKEQPEDEVESGITIKKLTPLPDEKIDFEDEVIIKPQKEEPREQVEIKKQKKKPEPAEEEDAGITVRKIVPLSEKEDEEENEITIKPPIEEPSEKITIRRPKKKLQPDEEIDVTITKLLLQNEDEVNVKPPEDDTSEQVTIKKPKKKTKRTDDAEAEITLKKHVPVEDGQKYTEDVSEEITIAKRRDKPTTEDEGEAELSIKKVLPMPNDETEDLETLKKEEKPDDVSAELTTKKSSPRKPSIGEESEEITIKKLKPIRKPSKPEIEPIKEDEIQTVIFRPRKSKTKEEIEQEFKISLDSYAEEEISLSTKVKLKKQKPKTYSEETAEDTVKVTQEIEDEGPVIEEIIDEGSEAEELPLDDEDVSESFHVSFKRRPSRKYSIFEEDEAEVSLKTPAKQIDFEEETVTIKPKRKESIVTFDEEDVSLSISKEKPMFDDIEVIHEEEVEKGDMYYSFTIYDAEADQAIDMVEGEKVYVIEGSEDSDWWLVKKHLTEETGWVPAKILMTETQYISYVQKKLNEKIDKLPILEKPTYPEKAAAPRFIKKLQPIVTPDGYTVQFECKVEGNPRPHVTWFRQTHIIKESIDFQMYYNEENIATLVIREVFPEDAGSFTCVAKNSAGFASSTTELIVEYPLSSHGSEMVSISRKSMSRTSSLADILEGIPPTFSKKPKSQTVPEETDVVVDSTLIGVPEPEIKWYKNGKRVSSKGNVTISKSSKTTVYTTILKIKKVEKKQEGRYKIVAKNRDGESSVEFTLKVLNKEKEPPEIVEPLTSLTVKKKEPITLSTTITGNPTPIIEWFKDDKPLRKPNAQKDGDTYSITIKRANPDDTAKYTVKAKNPIGEVETSANLTVEEYPENEEPPLFVERFEEQTVQEKAPLLLRAKVLGNPTPDIYWLHNNEPLEPSDRVKIRYDGENIELSIKETNSEIDSGDYKCVAVNSVGRASHGARVSIEVDTVKFTKTLKNTYEIFERQTLELECETSHSVRTKWWFNETEISGMDHRVVIQDGRTHKLVIKNISRNDEGRYKCTVKNQKTETVVKVQQRKLEFVKKLQDLEITEKDTAILEVEITSDTADVVWYKDGIVVEKDTDKFISEKQGGIRKLLIRSTSIHDEGEYTCSLEEQECKADVTVIELPPEIITPLEDKTVNKGDKTVFEIELSKGDALARWYKDVNEIQFSEHIQLSIDGKKQKLKIYNTEPEDEGIYSCEVGTQSSKARLIVNVPSCTFIRHLPEYTTVPINTDAEFEVELSKEDVEVTWWRNNQRIEKSARYTVIQNKRIRRLIIHKTTYEDEYEYTCTVEKYQLKTSSKLKIGDKPSPPRGPLEISGMTDTSFTIQWQHSESDGGSPILEYIVEMKEATLKKDFKKIGATKGDITDIAVNYLEKGHGYKFRITARNTIGMSDPYLPEDTIVAGSRITPPSPPVNLKIKESTSRSATLTWEPPLNNGGTEITGYIVEKKLEYMPSWEKVFTLEAFTLEYTYENLKEKSDYLFRVFAENSVGLSPPAISELVQMRTHATVPSPPTPPLEIRTIGPNAIVIEWGIPESDGGSPLLGYNIAIRDVKKTMWMEIGRVQKGVQKFTIRDLQEDHEYMIRIFAKNEIGLSEPLESDEPFKVLPSGDTDQDDFREGTDREPTSYSTETSTSWLRDNSMDADIHSYSKGTLLKKDEYFFRIWCYATKLFK